MINNQLQPSSILNQLDSHVGVALICFSASWCKPCIGLDSTLNELKLHFGDKLLIVKIDVDTQKEIVDHFKVKGVPVCIFYQNGTRIDSISGAQPKFVFFDTIDELIAK